MDPTCHPLLFFSFFSLCTLSSSSSSPTSAPRARLRPAPPCTRRPCPAPPCTRRRCSAGHAPALRSARAGTPAAPARRSDHRAPVLRPPPRAGASSAPARRSTRRVPARCPPLRVAPPPRRRSSLLRPELDELGRRAPPCSVRSSAGAAPPSSAGSSTNLAGAAPLSSARSPSLPRPPLHARGRRTTPSKWVGVVRSIWADHSDPDLRGIFPLGDEPNPPRLQTKQL